jgi:hypothetical protein
MSRGVRGFDRATMTRITVDRRAGARYGGKGPHRLVFTGDATLDTPIVARDRASNLLEGMALTATLQALPFTAGAALFNRLARDLGILANRDDVIMLMISLFLMAFFAGTVPFLAPKFNLMKFNLIKALYEPLFFDASLSLSDKFARWWTQPSRSLQLLTMLLMLSVLAVAVVSMG